MTAKSNPKTNLKNKKRGGFYWEKDTPYLSVTEILKIIDKPALRYWFGQQVYFAMLKDPTLSEKEALAAPYESTKGARSRGTTVHSIVEAYKHTQEQLDVAEEFRGYALAFYKFVEERKAIIHQQEKTVISRKNAYAGTLDLLVSIDDVETPLVVDVKTGKDIYAESFLQTAAYYNALLEERIKARGVGTLLLMENGEYFFKHEVERPVLKYRFEAFLAAKALYVGLNIDKLKKLGYLVLEGGEKE